MISSEELATDEPGNFAGKPWSYLQILVVVKEDVERYKTHGPGTAVIFELPAIASSMGIGCARYFTKKLAEKICPKPKPVCLVMDDSVQYWRGITLLADPYNPFGKDAHKDHSQRCGESICLGPVS